MKGIIIKKKRILMRFNIYEFGYPFDEDKDCKLMNDFIKNQLEMGFVNEETKKELKGISVGKVVIFNNYDNASKWSRNAILNPNLLRMEDLI